MGWSATPNATPSMMGGCGWGWPDLNRRPRRRGRGWDRHDEPELQPPLWGCSSANPNHNPAEGVAVRVGTHKLLGMALGRHVSASPTQPQHVHGGQTLSSSWSRRTWPYVTVPAMTEARHSESSVVGARIYQTAFHLKLWFSVSHQQTKQNNTHTHTHTHTHTRRA